MTELEKLLARAAELEQKADAGEDVEAAVAEAFAESSEPGVDPIADEEAAGLDDGFVEDPEDHEAVDDEEEKGYDFAPEDDVDLAGALASAYDVKAAGACPECGSTDRDELEDGRVLCGDCGFELEPASEAKGFDFDDLDAGTWDAGVDESKALTVGGDESTRMDEMDLLRARRLELGY